MSDHDDPFLHDPEGLQRLVEEINARDGLHPVMKMEAQAAADLAALALAYPETAHDGQWKAMDTQARITASTFVPTGITISGPDGDWAVRVSVDPPRVEINTGLSWDAAAKHFWNAVARVIHQEVPFGW